MAIEWPSGVPTTVVRESFSRGAKSVVIRSENDHGPVKRRRRFTAATRKVTYVLYMTAAQLVTFENWFDDDAAGGALSFNFYDPVTEETKVHTFVETYEASHTSGFDQYRVSMKLEIMP